jgi:hypothetical protein
MGELILASDRGDPLLARWRAGLGQAVAFTSDVKNRWAASWVRWPGYQKFWAHLVRTTMRQDTTAAHGVAFDVSSEVEGGRARVLVDALSADGHFISGLDGTADVIDIAHPSDKRSYPLAEVAPGRYEAKFLMDHYGAFLVRASQHRPGGDHVVAESTTTLSVPYPREYLFLPPTEAPLDRLAAITHGKRAPSAPEVFSPGDEKLWSRRELWPWCLWAALALLLVDVALRRVRVFGR